MSLTTNLQAFYKLSDLTDSSGNDLTLTNNGDVSFASGKIGNAAVFDGDATKYLSSSSNLGELTPSGTSLSLWFNKTGSNNGCVVSSETADHTGWFLATNNDNNIYFLAGTGGGWDVFNTVSTYNTSEWVHFVMSADSGGNISFYVNGSLTSTQEAADWSPAPLTFGRNIIDGTPFDGQIDAVGIWSRALNEGEVTELYNGGTGLELQNLTTGLQAFYKLSDLTDSSGNNKTLINNGDVTFGPNGANFNGTNYLYSSANLENLSEGTLTCKVTIDEASGFYRFVGLQNMDSQVAGGRILYSQNGSFQSTDYSVGEASSDSIPSAGTYWLATTFLSNGDVKIYVNGVYQGVLSGAFQPILGTNLRIGNSVVLDGGACSVDAVGLWNRVLNDAEIAELYNNGTGLELGSEGNNYNSYFSIAKIQGKSVFTGNVKFIDPMGYNS